MLERETTEGNQSHTSHVLCSRCGSASSSCTWEMLRHRYIPHICHRYHKCRIHHICRICQMCHIRHIYHGSCTWEVLRHSPRPRVFSDSAVPILCSRAAAGDSGDAPPRDGDDDGDLSSPFAHITYITYIIWQTMAATSRRHATALCCLLPTSSTSLCRCIAYHTLLPAREHLHEHASTVHHMIIACCTLLIPHLWHTHVSHA